ncbi:MAG: PIN domain-containing protein [Acidobacteria bacterium]|nr:MAG: PIN domain-containing protein [Acidobacteriota bacterium]
MKAFFDTSVLVPVFYGDHVHHDASARCFLRVERQRGCCAAHSLAEVFATLTRMPGRFRVGSEQAMLFIGSIRERLKVVALDGDEYAAALGWAAGMGVAGGAVYDALLARCALKASAESIYTWNERHFRQFGSEVARRVQIPD